VVVAAGYSLRRARRAVAPDPIGAGPS